MVSIFMVKAGNPDVVTDMALVDTACAKSVCGRPWAEDAVRKCEDAGVKVTRVPEDEPFRFGPGKRVVSTEAVLLPVVWGGHTFLVRVSVVGKDVPCLLSTCVLRQLGAIVDLPADIRCGSRRWELRCPCYHWKQGMSGCRFGSLQRQLRWCAMQQLLVRWQERR